MGSDGVRVGLVFDPDGILKEAGAEGHAGTAARGSNPACAAVTVLLRTAYEAMAAVPGVTVRGEAPTPGSLSFRLLHCPADAVARLRGMSDFLAVGLSGVEREYPGLIELRMIHERRN